MLKEGTEMSEERRSIRNKLHLTPISYRGPNGQGII